MRPVALIASLVALVAVGAVAGYVIQGQLSRSALAQADVSVSTLYPMSPGLLNSPDRFAKYAERASADPQVEASIQSELSGTPGPAIISFAYAPTTGLPGELPTAIRITAAGQDVAQLQAQVEVLAAYAAEQMALWSAVEGIKAVEARADELVFLAQTGIPPYLSSVRENEKKQAMLNEGLVSAANGPAPARSGIELQIADPRFYPPEQQIMALRSDRADQLAIVSQMQTNIRTSAIQSEAATRYLDLIEAQGPAAFALIEADLANILDTSIDQGVAMAPFVVAMRESGLLITDEPPTIAVRTTSASGLLAALLGAFAGFVIWLATWQVLRFRN